MKLHGAPPSHFTRKVRVILQELGLPFQFVPTTSLLDATPGSFGDNPLLLIPVLEDGAYRLVESDLICEYLLERYGKNKISFYPTDGDLTMHKQRLAVMNGGMSSGAVIMRARRSQIPNFEQYSYFEQNRAAILSSLAWLDKDLGGRVAYSAQGELTMLEITLLCYVEWALFREMVPNLASYPNLVKFQAHWGERASFAATRPALPVNA